MVASEGALAWTNPTGSVKYSLSENRRGKGRSALSGSMRKQVVTARYLLLFFRDGESIVVCLLASSPLMACFKSRQLTKCSLMKKTKTSSCVSGKGVFSLHLSMSPQISLSVPSFFWLCSKFSRLHLLLLTVVSVSLVTSLYWVIYGIS
jgi:hypothetical protein